MEGIFQKLLDQIYEKAKTSKQKDQDKLFGQILTLLSAVSELTVENLQKIGSDLANLISVVVQNKP